MPVKGGGRIVLEGLSDEQLDLLREHGLVRRTSAGEVLVREGDSSPGLIVVLAGSVALIDREGDGEREVSVQGRGGFVGLVAAVTGERVYVTAVVREAGEVLVVASERLHELVTKDRVVADAVVRVLFQRREWLTERGAGIQIVGSRYSPDTHRLREFATRNRVAHVWIEPERHGDADLYLARLGIAAQDTPVVLLGAGEVLRNPSNGELARAIGLRGGERPETATVFDVVIIGAGPAGLAAAVYGASNGLSTAVVDAIGAGGQAGTAMLIENYLAFPAGISGAEFAERALIQAEKFGARLVMPARAISLRDEDGYHALELETAGPLFGRSIIVAGGVEYRRLEIPHLADYEGIGVAYTTAALLEQVEANATLVVIGGANSAGQASLSMAERGHHVYLLVRGGELKEMARYLIERIEHTPMIEVLYHTELRGVAGAGALEQVTIEDTSTGALRTLEANAICILIGAEPRTHWLADTLTLDEGGFIVTGPGLDPRLTDTEPWNALGRPPYLLETSQAGVFAAGDVRSGSVKRVATAAGEGSMAVRFAQEYLLAEGSVSR
jgi:thioredoxin reductase (NADPH)